MRRLLLITVLGALVAAPLGAQRDARVEIALPAADARAREAPTIQSINVLSDRRLRDLLEHGFPARLHYTLELWSAGFFDDLKSQAEWDVIVRYSPLDRRFTATRIDRDTVTLIGTFDKLAGIEAAIARPFQPAFRPPTRHDRYYYNVSLEIEMLSVNDLDEVERWLRGELRPAVRGQRNPGTAISRGARTLVTRLLGGEDRRYEARSAIFRP